MIEIKAGLLRFTNYGFFFRYEGERPGDFRLKHVGTSGDVTAYPDMVPVDPNHQSLFQECTVFVDPWEYEQAVVTYIKAFLQLIPNRIEKDKAGEVCVYYSAMSNDFVSGEDIWLPIKADPRPNEESYTIEVSNE